MQFKEMKEDKLQFNEETGYTTANAHNNTTEDVVNELRDIVIDDFDIDRWHNYWMDVVDPRGKYDAAFQDFIMSGGGMY